MRFSAKSRYAIRAVIDLALHRDQEPISVRAVAERQEISADYLEQIVRRLRQHGLLKSARGPSGGFSLARPPEEITVAEVLRALEETVTTAPCLAEDRHNHARCPRQPHCAARLLWETVEQDIEELLGRTTIADIVSRARAELPEAPEGEQ
jgi:Rrf2 family protein